MTTFPMLSKKLTHAKHLLNCLFNHEVIEKQSKFIEKISKALKEVGAIDDNLHITYIDIIDHIAVSDRSSALVSFILKLASDKKLPTDKLFINSKLVVENVIATSRKAVIHYFTNEYIEFYKSTISLDEAIFDYIKIKECKEKIDRSYYESNISQNDESLYQHRCPAVPDFDTFQYHEFLSKHICPVFPDIKCDDSEMSRLIYHENNHFLSAFA